MKYQSAIRLSMLVALSCTVFAVQCFSQVSFDKVEVRTTFGNTKQGSKGRLIIERNGIRFVKKEWHRIFLNPPNSRDRAFLLSRFGQADWDCDIARPGVPVVQGEKTLHDYFVR